MGETYTFEVPPLIDEATFRAAQQLKRSRGTVRRDRSGGIRVNGRGHGRTGHRGLLQGLLTCGKCGEAFWTDSRYVKGT